MVLDRDYDISAEACDQVIDVVRQNVPYVVVDLPHTWTPWTKRMLLQADEIIITAVPDLANLRNAKNIVDLLQAEPRPTTPAAPRHQHGQHAEAPGDQRQGVRDALDLKPYAVIDFDTEMFGQAANNGQMIEEFNGKAKSAAAVPRARAGADAPQEHQAEKKTVRAWPRCSKC